MNAELLFAEEQVGGWAGRTHAPHPVAHPADVAALQLALHEAWGRGRSVIAKGAGCSYADQITNRDGAVIDCRALSGIRSWDPATGIVSAWAGTSLANILRVSLQSGWTVPGVPGSFAVTVGGALANNVHGKDAHRRSFGSAVRSFELLDAEGQLHVVTPGSDGILFNAVIGGLGLLGIVASAELQLLRIPSAWVETETVRTASLEETLQVFRRRHEQDFALAWLDGLPRGRSCGRGVISFAKWARSDAPVPEGRIRKALTPNQRMFGVLPLPWVWRAAAPMFRPPGLRLTNAAYHALAMGRSRRIVPFPDFYFLYNQINGLDETFRPHGFVEVQALVAEDHAPEVCRAILDALRRREMPPIFVAMKGHVGDRVLLGFPGEGVSFTVALRKPGGDRTQFRAGLSEIYELVIAAGGRVNLSKDEFLSADQFRRMYKGAGEFAALKRRLDSEHHFQSDQFRRLFADQTP